MGWTADEPNKGNAEPYARESETAKAAGTKSGGVKSKRGVILILAGLAVTGIAAGWSWLRRLPKD